MLEKIKEFAEVVRSPTDDTKSERLKVSMIEIIKSAKEMKFYLQ